MPSLRPPLFVCWVILCLLGLIGRLPAVYSQSILDGYWDPIYDEDSDEREGGPDQGDFAGLPITPAAVGVARSWSPEELTEPQEQCRPHPSIYGFRGVGQLRIWEVRDSDTQQQTEIDTWIEWMSQYRRIWMNGHPHPPPWAPETWQGFSVGRWVGDVLVVHTDGVRAAWLRRNGLPSDDNATMDEQFIRYGDVLTDIMMISDRQYLSEPMVKSNEFKRVANGAMVPYACLPVDEIPRAEGIVPMHLPGYDALEDEWAVRHQVPLKAAAGGAETMYPEYQDAMRKLPSNPPLSEIEAAEKKIVNQSE